MDRLKQMKEHLTSVIDSQISGNLEKVDAKELGEAVDMVKDLAEAIYYCTITEAMEESTKEEELMRKMNMRAEEPMQPRYYTDPRYTKGWRVEPYMYNDPMDMERMYYSGGRGGSNSGTSMSNNSGASHGSNMNTAYYHEHEYPMNWRDEREGHSPMQRKMYMESKEMHQSKDASMKELEKYIQELSADITDMIKEATPEEKQLLQQKISILATKIK